MIGKSIREGLEKELKRAQAQNNAQIRKSGENRRKSGTGPHFNT